MALTHLLRAEEYGLSSMTLYNNIGMVYLDAGDPLHRFWELWTAKEALFKLTGHGPLLCLSKLALPQDTAIWYAECHGCALSVAQYL